MAKQEYSESNSSKKDEVSHVVLWVGDLMVIYVKKTNLGKESIQL